MILYIFMATVWIVINNYQVIGGVILKNVHTVDMQECNYVSFYMLVFSCLMIIVHKSFRVPVSPYVDAWWGYLILLSVHYVMTFRYYICKIYLDQSDGAIVLVV
ncbi:hypothetical protein RJT34_32455 [Clitoria ternatea]|uniref:Uncharacterized protein n=1 Tax=Clitoria ternatea TaxID=43366 RepID=A0AAN9F403_CLITE